MKKNLCLIVLVLFFHTISHAQTNKEIFESGVRLFKQGEYQSAIDTFTKLIELAPENADAYKNRGVSYMKLDQFDLAIQDFETAKAIFPELNGLYSNLGVAWYYKKEYEKAIDSYNMEILMAPENAVAYFNRALCLAELDQNQKALVDLSTTLKLKPDFYWAICYKADLLAMEGKSQEAIEAYELAITQDSKNDYAVEKLAELKEKVGLEPNVVSAPSDPEPKSEPETQKKPAPQPTGYAIQVGAFQNPDNAQRMKDRLIKNGFDSTILVLMDKKDRTWHLVRSGSYESKADAKKAMAPLADKMKLKSVVRPKNDW